MDCRRSTKSSAGWGFAEPGTSKGHNIVMALWIDDDPKVICRSDPSSRDSIEPIRSQVSKHPPGREVLYYEELPPYFANGPALVSLEINSAFGILTGSN